MTIGIVNARRGTRAVERKTFWHARASCTAKPGNLRPHGHQIRRYRIPVSVLQADYNRLHVTTGGDVDEVHGSVAGADIDLRAIGRDAAAVTHRLSLIHI